MAQVPYYNPHDFRNKFTLPHKPGADLRPAVITGVNPSLGTVNLEWLDHPGNRQNILLTTSGQGIFELPTVGSQVLVGFDNSYSAYIVRHMPVGYRDLVGTERDGQAVPAEIRKIFAGEKMLVSYSATPIEDGPSPYGTPQLTGTYFYMSNVGDIFMTTAEGDSWKLDRIANTLVQDTMNYKAITEAGILDFGLTKRDIDGNSRILSTAGVPLGGEGAGVGNEQALTEFRVRVLETADADPTTDPEVNDPLIDFTLGTKVSERIDGDNRSYSIATTDNTYAVEGNEIIIQLKTKADQGFEFTVDKEGNVTLKVRGNIRMNIEGDAQVNVDGDTELNSNKTTLRADQIRIAGDNKEQPVVLKEFLSTYYNNHTHLVPGLGTITTPPQTPAPGRPGRDVSKITKVD